MLQETAASFLAEEGAIAKQLRHWRDTGCKDGFGHGLWKQFAELGLTGICIPEEHGGLGLGADRSRAGARGDRPQPHPLAVPDDSCRRVRERSRAPRMPSAGIPGILPARPCSRSQSTRAAVTRPSTTALEAERQGNGFVLNGAKQFVVQGASADMVVDRRAHRRIARRDATA